MGEERIKNATSAGMLRWCQYLSLEKVVLVFEPGKRSCHYMMLTLPFLEKREKKDERAEGI